LVIVAFAVAFGAALAAASDWFDPWGLLDKVTGQSYLAGTAEPGARGDLGERAGRGYPRLFRRMPWQ
jgi:hypothetical protein